MKRNKYYLLFAMLALIACREEYLPPAITATNNFLVVEGIINSGNDSTIFKLSRTKNLSDTTFDIPELFAGVTIESKTGVNYLLASRGNGIYSSGPLALNPGETYRLRVSTASGGLYESDYVPVKPTPPIDSITWKQDNDVTVYLNTHDDANNTRYYRWDFSETWEYHTFYDSNLGYDYVANLVYYLDSSQLLTRCWSSAKSADVFLGTTDNLTQDIVVQFPLTKILNGSDKMSFRYSIMVKQYALSKQAFEYWQLLKRNAKELGSIFGTQPAELIGNIKCISNPAEPVIGFVSASSVAEKRIFIKNNELINWDSRSTQEALCTPLFAPLDSISFYLQKYRDYSPAYFVTNGPLAIAKNICVDCRLRGGSNNKPAFW